MILTLDATNRKLQASLSSAGGNVYYFASYCDSTATGDTFGASRVQSSGTTAIDVVGSPAASTQRNVKSLVANNTGGSAITVTLLYYDAGFSYIINTATIQPGASVDLMTMVGVTGAQLGVANTWTAPQTFGVASATDGSGLLGVGGVINRIINGDMRIDQRNRGVSLTIPGSVSTYGLDRWVVYCPQASKLSTQQMTATPFTGFTHYQRITSLSAYTPLIGEAFQTFQPIEGYNVSDLMWGTANAKPITLFLRVRSSLTGTFGGSIRNVSLARSYPFTFSIPVANTETLITLNIPGDTSGTWATDNTAGLFVALDMGSGATYRATAGAWTAGNFVGATGAINLVSTSGATFDFTGVELYPGTLTSPPGAWRPYAIEEMLCKRYLPAINATSAAHLLGHGQCASASAIYMEIALTVKPRVPPTGMSVFSGAQFNVYQANGTGTTTTGCAFGGASNDYAQIIISGASGLVAGNVSTIYINTSSGYILFTGCEL